MEHSPESDDASRLIDARVIDAGGNQASVVSIQQSGPDAQAWLRLDEGAQVLVPLSLLMPDADGVYRLPFVFNLSADPKQPVQMTFPVMEEELHVTKRVIDTGRGLRVHKTVSEHEEVLDQPLLRERLVVEHVPVGRVVEDAELPRTRYEGDTLVVPVLEEVLVVKKQLLLKEEVRITRQQQQVQVPRKVLLRSEQVAVERFDEGENRRA